MKDKNVLMIGTPYMGIYLDVIEGFTAIGYKVDYIQEINSPKDPDNLRGYKGLKRFLLVSEQKYCKKMREYWKYILSEEMYRKIYDVLFVLDGQSLHPYLFEELRRRNPAIICINYLFDTTNHVYRFDKKFSFFDKVYTFDIHESKKYKIELLPIYWKEEKQSIIKYDIFAFGGYTDARFQLYRTIKEQADQLGLSSYVKVYTNPNIKQKGVKAYLDEIYKFIFKVKSPIPREVLDSDYNTHDKMTPIEFREMIGSSRIIVDTAVEEQDGLTARFMWAIGAHKKIITTNKNAEKYPFYNSSYIYIVEDIESEKNKIQLINFIKTSYDMSSENLKILEKYRIDNWLLCMLKNK